MMTAIKAATARMGENIGDSEAADWFRTIGDVLDCVIPIALAVTVTVSLVLVVFDLVH